MATVIQLEPGVAHERTSLDIGELVLTRPTYGLLKRARIHTLTDLQAAVREWRRIPQIGPKRWDEIAEASDRGQHDVEEARR